MKNVTLLVLFSVSFSGFALQQPFVGTWCQKYDDFTDVLIIEKDHSVKNFSAGNRTGEVVPAVKGFVSLGASSFSMTIEGEDMGIVDFKVRSRFGVKKLILLSADGTKSKYSQCKVRTKQ